MMSDWEDRMAERAKVRQDAAKAEDRQRREAEAARLDAKLPPLPGESDVMDDPIDREHLGHRTHAHPWHGLGVVTCSCGAPMGLNSFIPPDEPIDPEPCPVCVAHGLITANGQPVKP